MANETEAQNELVKKFGFLEGKVRVQRQRRIFAEVPYQNFIEVFEYAVGKLGFCILCTITGLDEIDKIAFIYHVAREDGTILNIKTGVPKEDPSIKTITYLYPGADIYERELMDLLGVKIEGLPEGKRYPLSDDWPKDQFPLRKDWKPDNTKKT